MAVVIVVPRPNLEHNIAEVEPISREQAGLDRMDHVGVHEDLPRQIAAPIRQVGVLVVAAQREPVIAVRLPVDDDATGEPRLLQRRRPHRKAIRRPELLRRHGVRIEPPALGNVRRQLGSQGDAARPRVA